MKMNRRMTVAIGAVLFVFTLASSQIRACSWATGYFFQVTSLKGTLVGSNLPILHSFRWFRLLVARPKSKLTLFDYCWPCDTRSVAPVKTVIADNEGKFDFGTLKPGHYYLRIDDDRGPFLESFTVEVKGPPNPEEREIIDISHVAPDCTGGHELILK